MSLLDQTPLEGAQMLEREKAVADKVNTIFHRGGIVPGLQENEFPAILSKGDRAPSDEVNGLPQGEFEREDRYIVVKKAKLTKQEIFQLESFIEHVLRSDVEDAVVVEKGWPIYEETWDNVERVATGMPSHAQVNERLREENNALIMRLDEAQKTIKTLRAATPGLAEYDKEKSTFQIPTPSEAERVADIQARIENNQTVAEHELDDLEKSSGKARPKIRLMRLLNRLDNNTSYPQIKADPTGCIHDNIPAHVLVGVVEGCRVLLQQTTIFKEYVHTMDSAATKLLEDLGKTDQLE